MIITAGIYKGRKIESPDEKITRPTLSKVRMGVFNTLYSIIGDFESKTFLDVFGGSGIMGLEALSRGFSRVKVFEKNPKVAQILKKNYQTVGLKPDLTIGDSTKLILKTDEIFDVVYIDPPYMSGIYEDILSKVKGNIIIVEHSETIEFDGYEVLKQKNYGGKIVSFLR
ncbi:16S rRNA (guanine(966)-N(2))-methyltransferase RsmD [bacterium]|nr:16S rRNA (guanine(966)-N(2))-methyltransferase RsmD [bacterium]